MNPPTIAVVDDETPFLEVMGDLLVEEGYTVWTYKNGPEAYKQLKQMPPTLIILDIRYAGGNFVTSGFGKPAGMCSTAVLTCTPSQ